MIRTIMRKYFLNILPLVMATVLGCGFTSCGDDDDNTPQDPTTTTEGNLLRRTGDMSFSYDNEGRCTTVSFDGDRDDLISIDYGKRTITMDGETYNVTFNSSGYVTELNASFNEREDGYIMKVEGQITLNYDGNGHLTSGTSAFTGTISAGNGQTYTEKDNSSIRYTWNGDLLTNVYCEEESKVNDIATERETTTYDISYSDTDNKDCRWNHAAEDFTMTEDGMGFTGLLGKAPAKLAASYTENETDNGLQDRPSTKKVTYTLNSNGTIKTEKVGNDNYTYTYFPDGNNGESKAKTHGTGLTRGTGTKVKKLFGMKAMKNALKERLNAED